MPRNICRRCHYPKNACVCAWITEIASPVDIVILQHYRESRHAKNTVRLVQLAMPDVAVRMVKPDSKLEQVLDLTDSEPCAVMFPTAASRALETNLSEFSANQYRRILFLDGSWKQARGMAQQLSANPDLHFYHFEQPQPSRYQIRHTRQAAALSTIEAIALTLNYAFSIDSQPLLDLLAGFQKHWRGPLAHRRSRTETCGAR